jgi:transcriptional regulator with XRE-family HTH domain
MANDLISIQKKLGATVKRLRTAKKQSLWDVANNSNNLDASKIGKIEKGEFNLQLKTIVDLANALEIPIKRLFEFD